MENATLFDKNSNRNNTQRNIITLDTHTNIISDVIQIDDDNDVNIKIIKNYNC